MLFRWAFDGASRGLPVRFRFYDAATYTILEENFRRANFPCTHLIRQRCADGLMPPHLRACALVGSRDNFRASTTLNFHGAAYTVRHTKKGWIQERQE